MAAGTTLIPRRRKGPDISKTARGRHHLDRQTRARVEALIETLIELLNEADGDPDEEEDDWSGGAEDSGIADLETMRAEDGY